MMRLDNSGESLLLQVAQQGELAITLQWRKCGFWKRLTVGAVDLDLGCCYEMADGRRRLIDCLQFGKDMGGPCDQPTRQGCLTMPPYIWHQGDNPGIDTEAEEAILVNTKGLKEIKKIYVYVYIYDGPARWDAINTELRISLPQGDEVAIALSSDTQQRFVAVALLEVCDGGKALKVTNLSTYHDGHNACDLCYGWGFRYHQQ